MQVTEITTINELESIEQQWNRLFECSADKYVFLMYDWVYSWCAVFNKEQFKIFVVTQKNELIGIMPLRQDGKYFKFISTPHSDYLSFIVRADKEVLAIKTFLDYMNEQYPDFIMELNELSEQSSIIKNYPELKSDKRFLFLSKHKSTTYRLLLEESWEELVKKTLHKKLKKNIKRGEKRLSADEVEIEYYTTENIDCLRSDMDAFFKLHVDRMKDCGLETPVANSDFQEFHQAVADKFLKKGLLQLAFTKINGKAASVNYCFAYLGRVSCYLTGISPEYYNYSIGNLNFKYSIMSAIEREDNVYDFLRGTHNYKNDWGCTENKNYRLFIMRKSIKNRLHILQNLNKFFEPKNMFCEKYPRAYKAIRKIFRSGKEA